MTNENEEEQPTRKYESIKGKRKVVLPLLGKRIIMELTKRWNEKNMVPTVKQRRGNQSEWRKWRCVRNVVQSSKTSTRKFLKFLWKNLKRRVEGKEIDVEKNEGGERREG